MRRFQGLRRVPLPRLARDPWSSALRGWRGLALRPRPSCVASASLRAGAGSGSRGLVTTRPWLPSCRPLAEHEPDRRAEVAEGLAQLVFEVTPVAEVDGARLTGEEDEGRRGDGDLRRVEQLG